MSFGGGSSAPDIVQAAPDPNIARLAKEAAAREAEALRKRKGAMAMIATSPVGATSTPQTKATTLG